VVTERERIGEDASAVAGAVFSVERIRGKNRKHAKPGAEGVTPEFGQRTLRVRRR
jgi:hypothetical protein